MNKLLIQLKFDKERFLVVNKIRISFFVFFLFTFVITEIGRYIYRPYIYSNNFFDFWIADTIGNFTGTMAVIFFNLSISNPGFNPGRLFILLITTGLIIYELVQGILPGTNTLDWRDIIATIVAGFISWGIYEVIWKTFNDK
jgi:hypothetical protein